MLRASSFVFPSHGRVRPYAYCNIASRNPDTRKVGYTSSASPPLFTLHQQAPLHHSKAQCRHDSPYAPFSHPHRALLPSSKPTPSFTTFVNNCRHQSLSNFLVATAPLQTSPPTYLRYFPLNLINSVLVFSSFLPIERAPSLSE